MVEQGAADQKRQLVTFSHASHVCSQFFSRPLPKTGRELQTELNTMMNDGGREGGPLAKNQPEASLRAVSQL